ncbi:MAG: 4Fe-4S dicluster domain-containing protein [Sulfuritalea sp.]|nr:4Fe-4S dicluster domain-containing protein [Sulfuritalea sp.]
MWRSRRDPRFSPEGIAKARQNGATVGELNPVLDACTLCGACDPVCPENIDLSGMIMALRRDVPPADLPRSVECRAVAGPPPGGSAAAARCGLARRWRTAGARPRPARHPLRHG